MSKSPLKTTVSPTSALLVAALLLAGCDSVPPSYSARNPGYRRGYYVSAPPESESGAENEPKTGNSLSPWLLFGAAAIGAAALRSSADSSNGSSDESFSEQQAEKYRELNRDAAGRGDADPYPGWGH